MQSFYNLLFRDSDAICFGDVNAYKVYSVRDMPLNALFFSINPLDAQIDHEPTKDWHSSQLPRRSDLNVVRYQNFLFEIDRLSLEQQERLYKSLIDDNILATIVYSGSKSYHLIVSLQNSLALKPHKQESIEEYKAIWSSIAKYIEAHARALELPSEGILDQACKNPSRLSRIPGVIRPETQTLQALIHLGSLMSDSKLAEIRAKFPTETVNFKPIESVAVESLEEFELKAPQGLKTILELPINWAGASGNYQHLYKASLWAIDSTNVSKEVFLAYLSKYTFPFLIFKGYPTERLIRAINHAYEFKKGI